MSTTVTTYTNSATSVQVDWAFRNPNVGADGIVVERSPDNAIWAPISGTLPPGTTSFLDDSVATPEVYYRVKKVEWVGTTQAIRALHPTTQEWIDRMPDPLTYGKSFKIDDVVRELESTGNITLLDELFLLDTGENNTKIGLFGRVAEERSSSTQRLTYESDGIRGAPFSGSPWTVFDTKISLSTLTNFSQDDGFISVFQKETDPVRAGNGDNSGIILFSAADDLNDRSSLTRYLGGQGYSLNSSFFGSKVTPEDASLDMNNVMLTMSRDNPADFQCLFNGTNLERTVPQASTPVASGELDLFNTSGGGGQFGNDLLKLSFCAVGATIGFDHDSLNTSIRTYLGLPVEPPEIELIHVMIMGQSQPAGFKSTPALTLTPDPDVFTLTKVVQTNPSKPLEVDTVGGEFAPVIEGDDYNLGGVDTDTESLATSFGQQLKAFLNDPNVKICVTVHYYGGATIQELDDGGTYDQYGHDMAVAASARVKNRADDLGYTYKRHFVLWHGGGGLNPYETAVNSLVDNLVANTNAYDSNKPYCWVAQQRVIGTPDYGEQLVDVVANNTSANVRMAMNTAWVPRDVDLIHYPNHSTRWIAVNIAKAAYDDIDGAGSTSLTIDVSSAFIDIDGKIKGITVNDSEGTIVGAGAL